MDFTSIGKNISIQYTDGTVIQESWTEISDRLYNEWRQEDNRECKSNAWRMFGFRSYIVGHRHKSTKIVVTRKTKTKMIRKELLKDEEVRERYMTGMGVKMERRQWEDGKH